MGRAARRRVERAQPALRSVTGPVAAAPEPAPPAPRPRPQPVAVRTGLRKVAEDRRRLDERQSELVRQARAEGVAWAEIGRLLGVTGQAVSQRYGRAG